MAETEKKQAEQPRVIPPITLDRMRLGEHAILDVELEIPAGLEPEDLLPVAYWTHIAGHLLQAVQQGKCFLHCFSEDGSWYARYLVRDAGQNWAKVTLLDKHALERIHPERRFTLLPGHSVQWAGSFTKWRVIRDSDSQVLKDKFNTEGDAYAWLSEYGKAMAA